MADATTIRVERCLDRMRGGDADAHADLLDVAGDRLTRLARKMFRAEARLRRWEETTDVLQSALLRLLRRLRNVTPASPRDFYRLAAGEIRRALIDLARHHFGPCGPATKHDTCADAARAGDSLPAEVDTPDRDEGPGDLAQWSEFHERVDRLPDDEREVFELVWYQGLPYSEAADVLGVSARTVTRRWQSACLKLDGLLGEGLSAG